MGQWQWHMTDVTYPKMVTHLTHDSWLTDPFPGLIPNVLVFYKTTTTVRLGGAVVRTLDLRLKVAGSIPAAALSSATLDKLFTHTLSSASEVTTLWRYINQFNFFILARVNGKNS